jgi:hypothetical protein
MEPHTGLAEMEQLVRDELHQYLPGGTGTEMIQLVEAVARCATSLADRQTLERSDVLLARPCTVDCAWYVRSATSLGVFVASSLRIPAAPWSTCSPTYLDLCRRRAATEGGRHRWWPTGHTVAPDRPLMSSPATRPRSCVRMAWSSCSMLLGAVNSSSAVTRSGMRRVNCSARRSQSPSTVQGSPSLVKE